MHVAGAYESHKEVDPSYSNLPSYMQNYVEIQERPNLGMN